MRLKTDKKIIKDCYLGLKVTDDERRVIQALADKYTDGNISTWIRFSALNFVPKKEHLSSGGKKG